LAGLFHARRDTQKGVCAVCGRVETWRLPRKLSVDHDHLTGIVRGLLCHRCNIGIGYFEDDPERLHSAAKYLLRKRTPRRAKKFDPLVHFDPGL